MVIINEIFDALIFCVSFSPGGHSQYILVGVCRGTSKKGGLRHGHNPKRGGLRHGHNQKIYTHKNSS